MPELLRSLGEALLDTLLPACCPGCQNQAGNALCAACIAACTALEPACPCCARPLARAADPCPACHNRGGPELADLTVPFVYEGRLRDLVSRAKGGAQQAALRALCELWPPTLPQTIARHTVVCVIPPGTQRPPGRHLASSLARQIARLHRLPSGPRLHWCHPVLPQHALSERDRRRNLADALACRRPCPPQVLLVDDILTSGATLRAAGRALKRAGARHIHACCLARTPRFDDPRPPSQSAGQSPADNASIAGPLQPGS